MLVALVLAAGPVTGRAGEAPAQAADRVYAPYPWPAYPWPYPWPAYAGPCVANGFCAPGGWWTERPARRRPVAPEPPRPPDDDIWATSGSPWGYVRRLPPPTPADQIQPRYRDASTIRPEYAERAASAP